MPFCLCDGEAYVIENGYNLERKQVLSFFLQGHEQDYLLLYDESDQYIGMISYRSLVSSVDLESAIISEKLFVEDADFWLKARRLFDASKDKKNDIPVFNKAMEILYIAKYDKALGKKWGKMCELRDYVDIKMWKDFRGHERKVHIKGINDVLFLLREWLISLETDVSVEGEGWTVFGIGEEAGEGIVIDDESNWIDDLYTEYSEWLKDYGSNSRLKKLLYRPYVSETKKKGKIIFYLSAYPYFTESIFPLIFKYVQSGQEVVFVFPAMDDIVRVGVWNIERLADIVEKLETVGKCCTVLEDKLYCDQYDICFCNSEYSGMPPLKLTRLCRYVVAVQTTPIYTHMYHDEERFAYVFSEEARERIDYLVVSEYIADWICEHDGRWDKKLLRFGYPRLDDLYQYIKIQPNIPEEWKNRIDGKKVYLFTINMNQSLLNYFDSRSAEIIAIWRPHPLAFTKARRRRELEEIKKHHNVIIDDNPSYYAAFYVSQALISTEETSVAVNYLYMERPLCLFGNTSTYISGEPWHECAYCVSDETEILEFIEKFERGENLMAKEQVLKRKYVAKHFDGKVCDRIFEFFSKRCKYVNITT